MPKIYYLVEGVAQAPVSKYADGKPYKITWVVCMFQEKKKAAQHCFLAETAAGKLLRKYGPDRLPNGVNPWDPNMPQGFKNVTYWPKEIRFGWPDVYTDKDLKRLAENVDSKEDLLRRT